MIALTSFIIITQISYLNKDGDYNDEYTNECRNMVRYNSINLIFNVVSICNYLWYCRIFTRHHI